MPRKGKFTYEKAPEKMKMFINFSENLHNLVKERNLSELKEEIYKEPNLCHFYDRNNKSLLLNALEHKHLNIVSFLTTLGLNLGRHEINHIYLNSMLKPYFKYTILDQNDHINKLLFCVKISNNDQRFNDNFKYIENAFRIIDSNESCSIILQIIAKLNKYIFYFDFEHETTFYINPKSSLEIASVNNSKNAIYIGAKGLLNNSRKYDVIKAIICELALIVLSFVYQNNSNPYPISRKIDSLKEKRFKEITKMYTKDCSNSELILTVWKMLIDFNNPSKQFKEPEYETTQKTKYKELLDYYENFVKKDFELINQICENLLKGEIIYNNLTEPLKAKLLTMKVNFQGNPIILNELIFENFDILNEICPIQIRDALLWEKAIKIGHELKRNSNFEVLDRHIHSKNEETKDNLKKYNKEYIPRRYVTMQKEKFSSKSYILADCAGIGKSVQFEKLYHEKKKKFQNHWICFINVRNFISIFNIWKNKSNLLITDIFDIFSKILKLDSKFEIKIFENLFKKNQVIFLFDDVDEIFIKHNNAFLKIIKFINNKTENQLLIASRPQCAEELEELLNSESHKFRTFLGEDRKKFIDYICSENKSNVIYFKELNKNLNKVLNYGFSSKLDNRINENPLIIRILVDSIFNNKKCNSNKLKYFYGIFECISEDLDDKYDKECSLRQVHQVLALKFLFPYNAIKNWEIVKKYRNEKKNWNIYKIQEFQFITFNPDFVNNPKAEFINFTQKTYAGFFIANFIISLVYFENKNDFALDDFTNFINLILLIAEDYLIFDFLMSFIKNNQNQKIHNEDIIKILLDNLNNCKNSIKLSLILLRNNSEEINSFWKPKYSEETLRRLLLKTNFSLNEILELLEISYGENWENENLLTRDENCCINDMLEESNVPKIFRFIESNLNSENKFIIYKKSQNLLDAQKIQECLNIYKERFCRGLENQNDKNMINIYLLLLANLLKFEIDSCKIFDYFDVIINNVKLQSNIVIFLLIDLIHENTNSLLLMEENFLNIINLLLKQKLSFYHTFKNDNFTNWPQNLLKDFFILNPASSIVDIFEYEDSIELFKNIDDIKKVQNFFDKFNNKLTNDLANKVLLYNYKSNEHPLLEAAKVNYECFDLIFKMFKSYFKSPSEIISSLTSKNCFQLLIADAPQILYDVYEYFGRDNCFQLFDASKCDSQTALKLITNHDLKSRFKTLLKQDGDFVQKFINDNFIIPNFIDILLNSVYDENVLSKIIDSILYYNSSNDKLIIELSSKKQLFNIFIRLSEKNVEHFQSFIKNIFSSNKLLIKDCIGTLDDMDYLSGNKNELFVFVDFLFEFLGTDQEQYIGELLQNNLYHKSDIEYARNCTCKKYSSNQQNELFDLSVCNKKCKLISIFYYQNIEEIDILLILIKKLNVSWNWVHNWFADNYPFDSIINMSNEVYQKFRIFIELVYKENKSIINQKIKECVQNS